MVLAEAALVSPTEFSSESFTNTPYPELPCALTPGEVGTLRDLAKIYVDLGDTSRARAFLEQVAQKNEAMEARAVSTVVRKRSASPNAASKKVKDVSERFRPRRTRLRSSWSPECSVDPLR
jgi:FimV-like protein